MRRPFVSSAPMAVVRFAALGLALAAVPAEAQQTPSSSCCASEGTVDRPTLVQSVTKSVTSALVGIALERGCLRGTDAPMLEFFPERAAAVREPRKGAITIRYMLRMRAGYGYEATDSVRWEGLLGSHYLSLMDRFPLDRGPGTGFEYSNLTSSAGNRRGRHARTESPGRRAGATQRSTCGERSLQSARNTAIAR